MELLKCDVTEGPRSGFKAIGVASVEGFSEFLSIEARFLILQDDEYFLPVRVIARDKHHVTALVKLPFEADSGANRVWVKEEALANLNRIPA